MENNVLDDDWGLPADNNNEFVSEVTDENWGKQPNAKPVDVDMDFGSGDFFEEVQQAESDAKVEAVLREEKKNIKRTSKIAIFGAIGAIVIVLVCYIAFRPSSSTKNDALDGVNLSNYITKDMRTDVNFRGIIKPEIQELTVDSLKSSFVEASYKDLTSNVEAYKDKGIKMTGNVVEVQEKTLENLGVYDVVIVMDKDNNQWNWFIVSGTLQEGNIATFYGNLYKVDNLNGVVVPSSVTALCDIIQ